jgi:hypothetical protein
MRRFVSMCLLACFAATFVAPNRAADKATKANSVPAPSATAADAHEHVHQALLAETLGDNVERASRLATALEADGQSAAAHWHSAEVAVDGNWLTLAKAEQTHSADPRLDVYRGLRAKAAGSPKLLRDLARWCERTGWDDLAQLHYAQILSSSNVERGIQNEAVQKLGLQQVGGAWQTREEIQAREDKIRSIETSLSTWRPRLKTLQVTIDSDESVARDRALKEMQSIDDPNAIAALETFLQDGGDRFQEEASKLLTTFPQYEATQALLRYAVLSPFVAAQSTAIAALKQRSKYDYLPQLLGGLVAPLKSQYGIAVTRGGVVQYTHAVLQEDAHQRRLAVSNRSMIPAIYRNRLSRYEAMPVKRSNVFLHYQLYEAQNLALDMELQKTLANARLNESNRPLFKVLEQVTDPELPRDPSSWWKWWQDYNEYYWPKPTCWAYESQPSYYYAGQIASCFVPGTLVRAQTGLVAIESLEPGDRVLAQDQETGELAYKAVVRTTIRPPTKMIRIKAGSDDISTTFGHPFWVAGHGWKMAKQLQAGDLLHSPRGAVKIESALELAQESRAHNLVVDDFNTYFVGQAGLLVHDNEFRKPTRAVVPGLVTD